MGEEMPLLDALRRYREEKNAAFHMPGHRGGRGFDPAELQAAGSIDYTEVPGLDDWHNPQGPIKKAQELMAAAYGVKASFFLVNGATSGVHALMMASASRGEEVIVPRYAHRSVFGGLALSGAYPRYMEPRFDEDTGIPLPVARDEVRAMLARFPAVKAVFVQSPTYFGDTSLIEDIANLTQNACIPLLVDEAHGAHFGFHPAFPESALAAGADAVVHGLHKSMPALSGAGCLHVMNDALVKRVWQALDLLTTTSPSWVLMASLDWARAWATSSAGYEGFERAVQKSKRLGKLIEGIRGLHLWEGAKNQHDPLKAVIVLDKVSLNGFEVDRLLRTRFGIQVELAGANYVLAMLSPFSGSGDEYRLARALDAIAREYRGKGKRHNLILPPSPQLELTPGQAFGKRTRNVPISQAEGKASAEMVSVYPPGVPCVVPGEVVTAEVLEYLRQAREAGASIQGLGDASLSTINIIDE